MTQSRRRVLPVALWLLAVLAAAAIVARTPIRTDMGAFLPRGASMAQQVLTTQATNGTASRLILLALDGAPPPILAALSTRLAATLRADPAIAAVANGDADSFAGIRDFVWANRYLLSPAVTPQHFTEAGLRTALRRDLGLLGSDLGAVLQQSLPADPTGEMLALLAGLQPRHGPARRGGVWFSADGQRALLLVHTKAAGSDIAAQRHALALIETGFASARAAGGGEASDARLRATGPGVFAVRIQAMTEHDVTRLSLLATGLAVALLGFAYRSPRVLLLGLLPVATGVLAAVAAVSLLFGFVHGITLGFGVTLIGEAIDYTIYLFTQSARGTAATATLARIWPTLRLGALTSILGFAAMLASSFTGFVQLGLFSIAGLIAAAATTRWVLPHLLPRDFQARGAARLAGPLLWLIGRRRRARLVVLVAALAAAGALATHRGGLWQTDLASLSPIPPAEQTLFDRLRQDLGVPDTRYFAAFRAGDAQQALAGSEALGAVLAGEVAAHRLAGFDVPSAILPSQATQRARQAALPDAADLAARLAAAAAGLPFRAGLFAPFLRDVAAAKAAAPLTRADLPAAFALRLDTMLIGPADGTAGDWTVIAPLTGPADPAGLAAALAQARLPGAVAAPRLVDLEGESDALLRRFRHEAVMLAAIGGLAILTVLLVALRSPRQVAAIVAPLVAAVLVTLAWLTLGDGRLSIFMVMGCLLIVAVGSNYALFFAWPEPDPEARSRAIASVLLANLCTVSAYGLMAVSGMPVLHDIGLTVAIGTLLSLGFAAVLSSAAPPNETVPNVPGPRP